MRDRTTRPKEEREREKQKMNTVARGCKRVSRERQSEKEKNTLCEWAVRSTSDGPKYYTQEILSKLLFYMFEINFFHN